MDLASLGVNRASVIITPIRRKCGAEMMVCVCRRFAGLGVGNVPKYLTGFLQACPKNKTQVLRNPDFGAVRCVKPHITSGIRYQRCRPALNHTLWKRMNGYRNAPGSRSATVCYFADSGDTPFSLLQRQIVTSRSVVRNERASPHFVESDV